MHIETLKDGSILLTAPVMVPGAKDCDFNRGEPPLTKKQIRDFKESYENYQFIDHEHEITRTGKTRGEKYDSYLLKEDTNLELFDGSIQRYPKGTWMMTSHVTDPQSIQIAKQGGYTGYSPAVRSKETADKFTQLITNHDYSDAEALKSQSQGGLIKDIPNPVVLSVTLTKKPCLHASKYCKIKNNGETMSEDTKLKTKVLEALGMSQEADVEALKSEVADIHSAIDSIKTENAEALKSMKEELTVAFTDALREAFADKSEDKEEDEEKEDEEANTESESETETESDDEVEEEDEEEKEADKSQKVDTHGKSKQLVNHNADSGADKSTITKDTYEFLGRNPDGTRKQ